MTTNMELRKPKYLSPSALFQFESDRTTFFEQRLSPVRKNKPLQQSFMGVGSGLDAFVKSSIHTAVYGENSTKGTDFQFERIFEAQVEEHHRDDVLVWAGDLWQQYQDSGAYDYLLADILASDYAPEMEFTIQGEVEGVPLLGKPDLRYVSKGGVHVISDWKVNGSRSKTGASPTQGYKLCLDYGSRTHDTAHKKYEPTTYKDLVISRVPLETFSDDWATQLAIYSWLLGEPIGSEDFVIRMEQISCRPVKARDLPRAKFTIHMAKISKAYQEAVLARIKMCWSTIEGGHIFTDVSRERSDEICEQLIAKAKRPRGLHPILDKYADTSTRFKKR